MREHLGGAQKIVPCNYLNHPTNNKIYPKCTLEGSVKVVITHLSMPKPCVASQYHQLIPPNHVHKRKCALEKCGNLSNNKIITIVLETIPQRGVLHNKASNSLQITPPSVNSYQVK
jgi:hypothetical protein